MFDDLKIRNKLVLLVAGPIIIIVLLAGMGAMSRQDTASASRNVEQLTALASADSDVVDALQRESLYSTSFVGSDRELWKTEMAAARKATDAAMVDALRRQGELGGTSAAFRSASTLATDAADKLEYIRSAVDQGYRWDQVTVTYQALQSTFLEVNDAIASILTDPQVANDLRTAAALSAFKATISQQGSVLVGAAEKGIDQRGTEDIPEGEAGQGVPMNEFIALLRVPLEEETASIKLLNSIADTQRKGEIRDALTSPERIAFESIRNAPFDRDRTEPISVDSKVAGDDTVGQLEDLHQVEVDLYDDVIARAKTTRTDAESAANRFIIGGVLALLAAIIAAVLLARRITRPLDHLTAAADRLSTEQMPRLVEWLRNPSEDEMAFEVGGLTPIEVESNDEIGKLANSFNAVQRVAGEVAAEQAALLRKGIGEMFVNLARRNQALLDRQIDFIDELERTEEDPDQLENLYRLDHLATRMRRNAESLLVLAGAEPPRRRGRPAPLANVVRAALAEVEDFGRIDLLSFDDILVASNVAADLAHLLSELMENATNFSPPETRVEVVGHRTKSEGYVVSVTDHGIGMSAEQIVEANESLAKPPLVGLALSRSLGFIVVGRLAGRHGVSVRMMQSPSGGVTAVVTIPSTLITDTPGAMGTDSPSHSLSNSPNAVLGEAEGGLSIDLTASDPAAASGALPPLAYDPFDQPAPAAPTASEAPEPIAAEGLRLDGGSDNVPTGPIARTTASELPPTDPTSGLPNRRAKASDGLPERRGAGEPEVEPTPAAEVAAPEAPAPAAVAEMPEALVFTSTDGEPTGEGSAPEPASEPAAHLDGPPPAAPNLPPRSRASAKKTSTPPIPGDKGSSGGGDAKPFFMEDAPPPKLFGKEPEPKRVKEPVAAPTPAAATPAAPVESPSAPAPAAAEPVATTTAGLAKRTPRGVGSTRAIPGADGERGVGATKRSPDEVRNLLSGFRAGQQRARTEDPVAAGSPEDKEPNE